MNTTKLKARINNILGELINEVTVGQGSSEEEAIYQQSALTELTALLDTEIAKAKIEQVESLLHYANNDDMMAVDIPHLEWVLATLKADTESNGQNTGTSTYTTPLPGAKFLDTPTKDTESIQGGE